MSFKEKSAWIMFGAMALVYGAYGVSLLRSGTLDQGSPQALLLVVVVFVAVAVTGHILIAALNPKETDERTDERDTAIALRGDRAAAHVLGAFALGVLAFAMIDGAWRIANLMFLGLAAAELTRLAWQIALYRRGV